MKLHICAYILYHQKCLFEIVALSNNITGCKEAARPLARPRTFSSKCRPIMELGRKRTKIERACQTRVVSCQVRVVVRNIEQEMALGATGSAYRRSEPVPPHISPRRATRPFSKMTGQDHSECLPPRRVSVLPPVREAFAFRGSAQGSGGHRMKR